MTIRARLVLTIAGVALLAALPGMYAARRLGELRDIARDLRREHTTAFVALGRLQTNLSELDRFQRSYVAATDPFMRDRMYEALASAVRQVETLEQHGYAGAIRNTREQLAEISTETRAVDQLITSGASEAATTRFETVKTQLARAQDSLGPVAETIDQESRRALRNAEVISVTATSTVLLALLASLAIAVLLGLWSLHGLVRPVRRLRGAMATVAGGSFVAPADLPYTRSDEIGDLARSFQLMTQQLAELDRLKAEFISMASHDLKTPINVVSGYAELMKEGIFGELNQKQLEVLQSIEEQMRVLTRLVTQILDISRMEAGGFRIEVTEVVLADLFDAVKRTFEALARQKGISYSVELDESLPRTVAVDPDRLRNEVLGNLLSNAFKFTPSGGSVRVKAGGDAENLQIEVADTGVGIPPDQVENIFTKYYQVGSHARAVGTGLGLAIAREVVEAHGGTIRATSEPDRGSTFSITLPIRHVSRPESRASR